MLARCCAPVLLRSVRVAMRASRFALLLLGAVAALMAVYQPAVAEGFFSRLLGWGRSQPVERRMEPPTFHFGYGGQRFEYGRGFSDYGWPQDYARYRTLCVRTCDGFYFPISDNVGRERLYQDARTCTARCDGEAQLYYYPLNGGGVETMVDMGGRPYAQMPNAFLYRKTLVAGCTCKPAPWSAEAAARHQGYKDEARALAEMGSDRDQRYAGPRGDGGEIEAYLMREGGAPQQTPWDGGVRRY
ncbi:MAG: DUF2865 domain-containing protein [Hyphomicrobium sp.]|nr:MAG: DUF2865 domain-containing protein [Hyphomicrobium sp.]